MEFRAARKDEIPKVFANVHEVWPHDDEIKTHINLRLNSPQHQWARWYVACDNNTIAASLGAYPYEFYLGDKAVKGIAIGAVHTPKPYRRRGLAETLLRRVHQLESQKGCKLSLLFSDIDPNYYGKLGYKIIPTSHGTIKGTPPENLDWQFMDETSFPFPATEGKHGQILHSRSHRGWLTRRHPSLKFLRFTAESKIVGQFICGHYENKFYALAWSQVNHDLAKLLSSCAYVCQEPVIHYWLNEAVPNLAAQPAKSEIPMICPLDEEIVLPKDWVLQPIDHV